MITIKVLYIYIGGSRKRTSVHKKVLGQIHGLRASGMDVDGLFFSSNNSDEELEVGVRLAKLPPYKGSHSFFQSYHRNQFHFAFIRDYIKERSEEYDRIFLRHGGNGPEYEKLLETVASKTLLYVPSNRIRETYCERRYAEKGSMASEFFSWWEYLRFWQMEKRLMKRTFPKLCSLVAFTPEFSQMLVEESKGRARCIYNRDGVDTSEVQARHFKPDDGPKVKMVFLKGSATDQKWSGLDRLINSIEAGGKGRFHLYITGNADRHPERYGRDFVTLTGRLSDEDLGDLIDTVDIGVSNLANYLIHFEETTNLKSRDYYARGLPFIQSNTMPDIQGEESRFYLRLPNDDSLLDMDSIYDFALKLRKEIEHPRLMHDFAVKHLDWQVTCAELAESIRATF